MNDVKPGKPVSPGAIHLFDGYLPGLTAGNYRLVFQQTVTLDNSESHHYYRDQAIRVDGPRFVFDAREAQSQFPPQDANGEFSRDLPFMVLRGRAFPWERRFSEDADGLPWIALLIVSAEELQAVGGEHALSTMKLAEWLQSEDVHLPHLSAVDEDLASSLRILELPADLFASLLPRREELPYLVHMRSVNTDDKADAGQGVEGDFSVVLANRLPRAGLNHAFLISLEGWADVIDRKRQPAPGERARVVCLADWSFTNREGDHSFGTVASNLDLASFGLKPDTDDPWISTMLGKAYTPLAYSSRDEEPQPVWYRGPLAGEQVAALADEELLRQRILADGFEDISYRSAWQLGRLLALGDPVFHGGLRNFLEHCRDSSEAARRINTFLDLHDEGQSYTLASNLVDWLARLMLLHPVPFHYLFADGNLLPKESLRFFHLDNNWLTALADGALSTAVFSYADSRDSDQIDFRGALSKAVYRYRARRRNLPLPVHIPDDFLNVPKTGFLLRSDLVTDWPGLEIQVDLAGAESAGLPPLLRLDHLGNGVMFGLVRGRLKSINLLEPAEGIRFGLDSTGSIVPRDLERLTTERSLEIQDVAKRFGLEPSGRLDITGLAEALGKALKTEQQDFGSAALAIQFLVAPESQCIRWQG